MKTMPPFVPGVRLSRELYEISVAPAMASLAPQLSYAAAFMGHGSDVLGYDTARSMDHDWGPRLVVLLEEDDHAAWSEALKSYFLVSLPDTIMGFPTRFVALADEPSVRMAKADDRADAQHRVHVMTLADMLDEHLGIRGMAEIDTATWISVTEQQLLEITAGEVFRDDTGDLTASRAALPWYPDDVWRYRMAAAWMHIAQTEPFLGRAGEVGDERGSALISAGLVRDLMRLSMLQERVYAPYSKWLGTAFNRTDAAAVLAPLLDAALRATEWRAREAAIVEAGVLMAKRQNALAISASVQPTPRSFYDRPFTVLDAERFAVALMKSVTDPAVLALPRNLGGMDQYLGSTDALVSRDLRATLRHWIRNR